MNAPVGAALVTMRGVGVHAETAPVRRIDAGSNHADSMSTFLVASVIMVSKPPMTPAMATAFFASAMTRSSGVSLRSMPSRVFTHFAVAGAAHDDLAAFELVEIEGVRGMADLVEHVIRGVGHVVDRREPISSRRLATLSGDGFDGDAAHDARGVTSAAVGVVDRDGKVRRGRHFGRFGCEGARSTS